MSLVWDGITDANILSPDENLTRHTLADASRDCDWTRMLTILRGRRDLVNITRPGGSSLYTPLHQAAHAGAPQTVAEELISIGAWRTLQNVRGERAEDVAWRQGHRQICKLLSPVLFRKTPIGVLLRIEFLFHAVIRTRAERLVTEAKLRLPPLEPLLEHPPGTDPFWFAIPGMTGGFSYRLARDGVEAMLITESWSRVAGGSGQRHEITPEASKLVDEGFV